MVKLSLSQKKFEVQLQERTILSICMLRSLKRKTKNPTNLMIRLVTEMVIYFVFSTFYCFYIMKEALMPVSKSEVIIFG